MQKKHKIIIIISAIITLIGLMVGLYFYGLTKVSKNDEKVIFVVEPKTSKLDIINNLDKANLIKSKIAAYTYVFFHSNMNLQAGKYELSRNMNFQTIMDYIKNGKIKENVFEVTFVEGKRLTDYVKLIADNTNYTESEIINKINDRSYLKTLVEKYWFLNNDILNSKIYYPLEGYFFPAKYEFYENATIENIIERVLNTTQNNLEPLKEKFERSNYSIHQIITIASIAELEAVNKDDRQTVCQVINKRLEYNMSLGMDVTTYYGAKKQMGSSLTKNDLNQDNGYNTRFAYKKDLPIGPICNPSLESIEAVFNPSNTDYLYFYADIKTGIVYFAKNSDEFTKIKHEIGGN